MMLVLRLGAALVFAASVALGDKTYEYSYLGCFVDSADRDLNGLTNITKMADFEVKSYVAVQGTAMTPDYCANVCSLGGFPYFGLQLNSYCFCGRSYGSHGQAEDSDCNTPCGGNASINCGGPWRNSVFAMRYGSDNGCRSSYRPNPSRPQLVVSSSYSKATYWTEAIPNVAGCIQMCNTAASSCLAVLFNRQARLCQLLKFALVPQALNTVEGEFYARG
uniref:WSC domain-containing protein n=2 Tax=Macrostomum lignano TaxID=282301 RepID=A0A1I8G2U8_9PLAT